MNKIAFGGGCHWCTEAVFKSLIGVNKVEQGWISSYGEDSNYSEAVIVHFDPQEIPQEVLIEIHLFTHSSTSNHRLREKYRSAVYYFEQTQKEDIENTISEVGKQFDEPVITKVLEFQKFKLNEELFLDYFYKDPSKAFCVNHIQPKLQFLMRKYQARLSEEAKQVV